MKNFSNLLIVAEMVWPDECWIVVGDRLISDLTVKVCEPHKNTERGNAQLMEIIFAMVKKFKIYEVDASLAQALVNEDREEIINIAAEVLK